MFNQRSIELLSDIRDLALSPVLLPGVVMEGKDAGQLFLGTRRGEQIPLQPNPTFHINFSIRSASCSFTHRLVTVGFSKAGISNAVASVFRNSSF